MTMPVALQELDSGRSHDIELPCVLGRGHEANLRLSDPAVSHRHALILEINIQIWIEDLGSTNGVYVNDHKITEKTPVKLGDCLQMGQTKLLVTEAEKDIAEQTLVVHSLDSRAARELDQKKLALIYEITMELSENQDVTVLANRIFSRLGQIFKQDRSYLALFEEDGTLQPVSIEPATEPVPLSRSIVNRVFKNGESLLLEDAMSDASLREQESIIALRIRSAMCVPVIYHSQIHGLFYLDRNVPGAYTHHDLEFLTAIAFILGPLIENARLWSELKNRYTSAIDTLRQTEARLIDMERTAAYVRLAQAMAHEIRNPLMAIGGLARRMARPELESPHSSKFQAIMDLVERVETVLKEVDTFVRLPRPQKKLTRVDSLIQEVINGHNTAMQERAHVHRLLVHSSRVMVPLDPDLFKKALEMVFKEFLLSVPKESELKITIQGSGNELEIAIGDMDSSSCFCEVFEPALRDKPWSLGLFLNIAHKIISDHGGRLLLDTAGHSAFPMLIKLPMTISL